MSCFNIARSAAGTAVLTAATTAACAARAATAHSYYVDGIDATNSRRHGMCRAPRVLPLPPLARRAAID
jgi:hypothetical protein